MPSNKKIIIVTRSMFAGGAERVIAQLANYFANENIECKLITTDKEKVLYQLHEKIELIPIGRKSNNKVFDKFARYKELRKIVKREKPSLVLSMPEDIGIYVILALLGTKIPVYVSERNNPWVMPDVKATRILRKFMYPFAKGIIFQTEMAKSFFPMEIQAKSIVLSNPVDESRIPLQYTGKREKVIVGVGRLDKQKNFPLLINSFAEFHKTNPDYSLTIYGEGKLRKELEELIHSLDLTDFVNLAGRQNNVLELMNSASMFVLSSDFEGMPNVLIEAMCMGMPVISTDCPSGGPKELIDNENNGLLIPVNDKDALVKAMNLFANDEFSTKLANNAYKLREKLTSKEVFGEWHDYLFN